MFKQFIQLFVVALLVKESVTKDKPTNAHEYTPDPVLKYSTLECHQHKPIPPKTEGVVRVAVVGDSTTVGTGSSRSQLEFHYDWHTQTDGSKAGYMGYPYLLSQLLKNHNKTEKYEIYNFAADNFTVTPNDNGKTYKDLCEYRQLNQSNPDILISMIGGKDSMYFKNFTPEGFVQQYTNFIKEMQAMPSSPNVLIVSPIYTASSVLAQKDKPFMYMGIYDKPYDVAQIPVSTWSFAQTDVGSLVEEVAKNTNIPLENYVDSEKLIKMDNHNTMYDQIHPNEHGYGVLAQELYMRMAMSPSLKKRINMIYESDIDQYTWVEHIKQENSERDAAIKAAKNSKTSLVEKAMSKFKIELSQKCHDQTYLQASQAQAPGLKYNFNIPTPKRHNEIRIAVAGDSATQGYGATTQKQMMAQNLEKRLSDQADGSQQGLEGWPYLLHSLLENNNSTTDYTLMNYGVQDATIIPGENHHAFQQDCRFEQMQKSLPNFVFLSFGSMDSHLKDYSEKKFIDSYVTMIKDTQKLPTRPMVFLMVPVATCQNELKPNGAQNMSAFITNGANCTAEQSKDMQSTIQKIASLTDIPQNHVVNAWQMIRDPSRKVPAIAEDNVHPNLKGMGEIAQEFFMKMSLSPNYLARQEKILSGNDKIYNKVIAAELEKQNISIDF